MVLVCAPVAFAPSLVAPGRIELVESLGYRRAWLYDSRPQIVNEAELEHSRPGGDAKAQAPSVTVDTPRPSG